MDGWFRRACHKDQTQRFASAKAAYEALVIAANLSRPGPDLAAISDTNSTLNDPSLFESGGSRVTGKVRSEAAAASTVPFSSSDEVSASWNGAAQSGALEQEQAYGSAGTNPGLSPSWGQTDADSANDVPSAPVPKNRRWGGIAVALLVAAGAVGGIVWASSATEVAEAPDGDTATVGENLPQIEARSEPSAQPEHSAQPEPFVAAEDARHESDSDKTAEDTADGNASATASKAATEGKTVASKTVASKTVASKSTPKAVRTPTKSTQKPKPKPRPKTTAAATKPTPKAEPAPAPIDLGF
jgi:hypothetical protein